MERLAGFTSNGLYRWLFMNQDRIEHMGPTAYPSLQNAATVRSIKKKILITILTNRTVQELLSKW
jgi:hypothetical protein